MLKKPSDYTMHAVKYRKLNWPSWLLPPLKPFTSYGPKQALNTISGLVSMGNEACTNTVCICSCAREVETQ